MRIIFSMALAMFLTIGSVSLFAADGDEPAHRHGRHKPPQEAFDACANLTENASCQFVGRNNETVEGVCSLPPKKAEDAALSCRPNLPPKDREQKPE